jgi:hypothetical protein
LAGGGDVRAISAIVSAVVGADMDVDAIARADILKRDFKWAILVRGAKMADIVKGKWRVNVMYVWVF